VEGLYCEALVLSDEVRAAFDLSGRIEDTGTHEDARIALSCEALRTTTRMMHAVAWLLNHRAYFMGELSEFQLRRYGRLAPDFPRRSRAHGLLSPVGADPRDRAFLRTPSPPRPQLARNHARPFGAGPLRARLASAAA
jgi:regulator of CtrA degradation